MKVSAFLVLLCCGLCVHATPARCTKRRKKESSVDDLDEDELRVPCSKPHKWSPDTQTDVGAVSSVVGALAVLLGYVLNRGGALDETEAEAQAREAGGPVVGAVGATALAYGLMNLYLARRRARRRASRRQQQRSKPPGVPRNRR
ncbi:hypothetical protein BESB_073510 [Besnoitia besnoiti]|uniref:Transmembrane protein n=1 Tax=Besnoitia besnoiti TaxID=94643 RepID=A0A2A9M8F1_BESBE|nr:uncharacterized protein BESB_073510 [Besnoitia besnoiti]PFH34199.1 hypothetical protein BESB_073510 [Besnoitia besnoiti]